MEAKIVDTLDIQKAPKGEIMRYWVHLISDAMGNPVRVPVIVARGMKEGPVLGVTAAVHGNELNGIPAIQRLFNELDVNELRGTIVGVPVVNIPSFMRRKRRFNDGTDLNHIMPGKIDGNVSQVYAYRIIHRIIHQFEYLLDLHTASQGRINSYYVRADMSNPITAKMAELQSAQIVVDNPPSDGTLRGAAAELGISAITLEVGNPNRFQKGMIRSGLIGIHNVLAYLKMTDDEIQLEEEPTVYCQNSKWIYTDTGGLLTVHPDVTDIVKEGELIATIRNVFGDVTQKYYAPNDGVVIGKSVSPVNQTGGRILHLGKV